MGDTVWRKAQATNEGDFVRWKQRMSLATDLHARIHARGINLRAASQLLVDEPSHWLDLMQNLSYPEVLLAQHNPTDLAHLGKRFLCDAHDVVLHVAIGDMVHRAARSLVSESITATREAPPAVRWKLAYGADRWRRLEEMVPLAISLPRLTYGDPQQTVVPEKEWCALLTILLCLAATFPEEWAGDFNATYCARLLQWFQTPSNEPQLWDALTTLTYSNWNGLRTLIADPISMSNWNHHVAQATARFEARNLDASAGRC